MGIVSFNYNINTMSPWRDSTSQKSKTKGNAVCMQPNYRMHRYPSHGSENPAPQQNKTMKPLETRYKTSADRS